MSSIILIGMPGAGKSTIAKPLAKAMGKTYIDTDDLIEKFNGKTLAEILAEGGYSHFIAVEENAICQYPVPNHVVATGGSVVYSSAAMEFLKGFGQVYFLDVALTTLAERLGNFSQRGVASAAGSSLEAIYSERHPLYLQWADATVDCNGKSEEEIVNDLIASTGRSLKL